VRAAGAFNNMRTAHLVVWLADLPPPHDDVHRVAPAKRVAPAVLELHACTVVVRPRVRAVAARRELLAEALRELDRCEPRGALLPLVAHEACARARAR
jgi:hypothetical protein